jgi:hypothetical protein
MLGRMMVSALALTGAAYAQEGAAENESGIATECAPRPTCAIAPPAGGADRVAYDAAFFAQFHPQTALDMVNQTPGFSLNGGDDRRGFSGAVGNLLIDGQRPVAKSQSVQTILQQIPAAQVVRVEVLRGAAVAGDASGQAVLVNVVRTPSAGSGVWNAGVDYNHRVAPQLGLSWSGRGGDIEYGIGGSYYSNYRSLPGPRRYYDAAGNLTRFMDSPLAQNFREGSVNGNLALPLLGGRLSTTGQYDIWRFHSDARFNSFDAPGGAPLEALHERMTEHQWSFEAGANYDRDFGPWSMALVSLATRRYYHNQQSDSDLDGAGDFVSFISIAQHRDSGETILRGTLSRNFGPRNHLEFGGEGALNTLDATFDFTFDDGSGPTDVFVPNANVTVEERRGEVFASFAWRPSERWSVETRLTDEFSTLEFTGDTNQSVRLSYFKPSVQISRAIGSNSQLRLRAYRDVGQLDFDDFVSATSVADNLINGGNPDLRPETAWRLELGGDLNLPGGTTLGFALTRHWISDTADLIEIIAPGPNPGDPDIRFDAPGNIGAGDAMSLTTNLTLPLGALLPGARLTLNGEFWQTAVTDPVTHQRRAISESADVSFEGQFRQDLNGRHLSWGVSFQKTTERQTLRHNETDTEEEGPYIDLFVETTAIAGLKIHAEAQNILNPAIIRERRFFEPDRNFALDSYQRRRRSFDPAPWFVLSVSGTF